MRCLRIVFIAVCCVIPVFGTIISGVFVPPTGDLGSNTHIYTFSGWSIVATGFGPNSPHLFGKNSGGDEIGVGLTNDPTGDNEITGSSYIQLDLFIYNPTPSTHLSPSAVTSLILNSTTSGETWKIHQSSTSGVLGACSIASLLDRYQRGQCLDIADTKISAN